MSGPSDALQQGSSSLADTSRLHLQVGWWSLLLFLTLGLILETLHGFKVGLYLDVSNSTRRLMWTLAHVHGTLLSILNLVFAMSIRLMPDWKASSRTLASRCLLGALALMPLGFLLGGVFIFGGDPGIGVILVPPGGLLLFLAVLPTASRSADSAARQARLTRSRTQSKISPTLAYIGLILGPYPVSHDVGRANIPSELLRDWVPLFLSWSAERVSSSSSRWRM